jgi:hypothetical protein
MKNKILAILFIIFSLIPIVCVGIMLFYSSMDKVYWSLFGGIVAFALLSSVHLILSDEKSFLFKILISCQFLGSLAFLILFTLHQKKENESLMEAITMTTYAYHITWYVIFIPLIIGFYADSTRAKCPNVDSVTAKLKEKLAECQNAKEN